MLHELVMAAERFQKAGVLDPVSYKPKKITWVIELSGAEPALTQATDRAVLAPDRQRSGRIGPSNLKPYLLLDDARYALGISEPGKEDEAKLAHQGFVELISAAWKKTGDDDVERVLQFLGRPLPEHFRQITPRDLLTFQVNNEFLCEKVSIQRFWAEYLNEELLSDVEAECAACQRRGPVLRIMPKEVVVMGQKCQITSFNLGAFTSFGRSQTTNSPLCALCATTATQALDHMLRDERHRSVLARDDSRARSYPLRNQQAVFWLNAERSAEDTAQDEGDEELWNAWLRGEEVTVDDDGPPPALAQAEALLNMPYTANTSPRYLRQSSFQIAVLTGNKGRLMVRDWISVSLEKLLGYLVTFVEASRIVDPNDANPQAFGIPDLIAAVRPGDPDLTRSLLRTAYLGATPPIALLEAALLRRRVPDKAPANFKERQKQDRDRQIQAAAIKLVLTHGNAEEARRMEQLDPARDIPPYLCGQLLAILEEAQRRAATGRLNSTLVDRFYGVSATSPNATFGLLIRRARTDHFPKIRRERRGHDALEATMTDVLNRIDKVGGFPPPLRMEQQAEFALGYYHQRAKFHPLTTHTPENTQTTAQGGQA